MVELKLKETDNYELVKIYELEGLDYFVDIILDKKEETYDAWLYKSSYGAKEYMFGLPTSQSSLSDVEEIIANELMTHIHRYEEEIEDYEDEVNDIDGLVAIHQIND